LLGNGELKSKLTIEISRASKSAQMAVEKAGGSIKLLAPFVKVERKLKKKSKAKAKLAEGAKAESAKAESTKTKGAEVAKPGAARKAD
jgi:large subunit ribosomal protein L15